MVTRLAGCSSVGSSRLRFRGFTDGGTSFPSRGSGGAYEGPLLMGKFQLGTVRSDSLNGGDGNLEAGDKDGNGGVGPKLGEM